MQSETVNLREVGERLKKYIESKASTAVELEMRACTGKDGRDGVEYTIRGEVVDVKRVLDFVRDETQNNVKVGSFICTALEADTPENGVRLFVYDAEANKSDSPVWG